MSFFRVPLEWKLLKISSMTNHQAWGTGIIIFNQRLLLMGKLKNDQTLITCIWQQIWNNVFVHLYMYSTCMYMKHYEKDFDICSDNVVDNLLHCNLASISMCGQIMCLSIWHNFWTSLTILSILCCVILLRIFLKIILKFGCSEWLSSWSVFDIM